MSYSQEWTEGHVAAVKCGSHHICQCQAAEMEKLKMRILTYENTTALRKDINEMKKIKEELRTEIEKAQKALGEVGLILAPFVDSMDW